jgi:hypothetical protein
MMSLHCGAAIAFLSLFYTESQVANAKAEGWVPFNGVGSNPNPPLQGAALMDSAMNPKTNLMDAVIHPPPEEQPKDEAVILSAAAMDQYNANIADQKAAATAADVEHGKELTGQAVKNTSILNNPIGNYLVNTGNEALLGLPEKYFFSDAEKEALKQSNEEHPVASVAGKVTGFVGDIAIGGGALSKAGKFVSSAVVIHLITKYW